jgi:membrane protein implicated in regulation of membrane protease activity
MASTGSSREKTMADRVAIDRIAADCERYWRGAGIARRVAAEMRAELEQHLVEASDDGRSPETVVGTDTANFAIEWAAAAQGDEPLPSWDDVFRRRSRAFRWTDVAILVLVGATIAVVLSTRGEGDAMDTEAWRWIWVGAALILGFAEIVTAGFFMLPFAVGAVIAAVLAFVGVGPEIQMAVFVGSSLISLIGLQRFVRHGDEVQPRVGSNRFVGQRAVVLEDVDRASGSGRARMDTEEWRATTDGDPIPAGTEVKVVDVRGARLVVEPTD